MGDSKTLRSKLLFDFGNSIDSFIGTPVTEYNLKTLQARLNLELETIRIKNGLPGKVKAIVSRFKETEVELFFETEKGEPLHGIDEVVSYMEKGARVNTWDFKI